MGFFGDPNIRKLRAKGKVKGLIKALGHKRSYIRKLAGEALGEIGDVQAVAPLIVALENGDSPYDHDHSESKAVAEALGKIGDMRAVEPLITALSDQNRSVHKAAVKKALGQLGSVAVDPLILALKNEDRSVRVGAAEALGLAGDARAINSLIAALTDEYPFVVQAAAEALGMIGDTRAMDPLIAALKGKDRFIRKGAAVALGLIGDAGAVDLLIAALEDTDCMVRLAASESLDNLKWRPDDINTRAIYLVAKEEWDKCVEIGSAAVGPLSAALKDRVRDVYHAAAKALAGIGNVRAVQSLIAGLKDTRVREEVADAFGLIVDAGAVAPLIVALKDGDCFIRQTAAQALDKLKWQPDDNKTSATYFIAKQEWDRAVRFGSHAVDPLIAVLGGENCKEEHCYIREEAAEALGKIGDVRAVDPLIDALEDMDSSVRARAAEGLGKISDARAANPLIAALQDENRFVRTRAVEAIGKIGDVRVVGPLILALKGEDSSVREAAAETLCQIGSHAVEPLIVALKDKDSPARGRAAEMLGKIGDARATDSLIAALKDENSHIREEATKALGTIGDTRAVDSVVAALKDKDNYVREKAAKALDKLEWRPDNNHTRITYLIAKQEWDKIAEIGSMAVDPLITALKDESVVVRDGAAVALGKIGDARAVDPLIAMLSNASIYVRKRAAESLVALYAMDKLDASHKKRIIAAHGTITQQHYDKSGYSPSGDCYSGHDWHEDTGIGVSFPV